MLFDPGVVKSETEAIYIVTISFFYIYYFRCDGHYYFHQKMALKLIYNMAVLHIPT